jgi:uncharacterized delta-60 repeat protein
MWFFSSRKARRTPAGRPPASRLRLEALEDRYLLSAGVLDPTFGSGGLVTSVPPRANSVAVQADGKILAGGYGGAAFTVDRYTPSGALDTTFGKGGSATVSFFSNGSGWLGGIAVDGSGKVVLAGSVYGPNGASYFALARLTSGGSLDPTFGKKGEVLTALSGELDAVVIQPDGKILVAGWGGNNAVLARYTTSGSLDSSFGSRGVVQTTLGAAEAAFQALTLQSDGKILAGGKEWPDTINRDVRFAVARFNPNGSLDTSFGSGGQVSTLIDHGADASWETGVHGLLVQGNGMIVAAGTVKNAYGTAGWEVALARYDPSGNLDPAFGTGGIVLTPSPGLTQDVVRGVALQRDGKIITAGWHSGDAMGTVCEVERYTSGGALDGTFGNGGIVTTSVLTTLDPGNAVTLQQDGDILVVGEGGLLRFLPSAPQVGTFTASPNPVTAGSDVTLTASNITDANPGATVTQVAFYADRNGDGVLEPATDTLLGYATQSSPGVWTYTFSTAGLTSGSYTLLAQAEDSYGVFGDPLALSLQVL